MSFASCDDGECRHENMTSNTVEPTCTESGYTEYTCDCGYSYISDYISAKGHTYKNTVYAPTCTEPGYLLGLLLLVLLRADRAAQT